ncbi:MAG: DUF1003 domain-containing protein [Phenylobacterium sp.]
MPLDPPAQEQAGSLAGHEEESIDQIAALHVEHHRSASALQRAIDWATDKLGRPSVVAVVIVGVAAWFASAYAASEGHIERPPFVWLELTATLAALLIAMLILVTQRRENLLAERRDQLTLELAILADKKSAKIIALLEEMRRDAPALANRADAESEAMARPADPAEVLAAIDRRTPGGSGS